MRSLDPILDRLNRIHSQYLATAEAIPGDRWRESPGGKGWSAGEVTAHVMMAETAILAGIKKMLQKPPQNVPLFKRIHVPLPLSAWRGKKVESPIPLDPNLVSERPAALEQLTSTRGATIAFIESTRGKNLSAYRFSHPFLGSLNAYEWFRSIGYHELRHTKQLREIVEIFRR